MAKISAVLNTYNASQYLDRVLDSLSGFDEILVCDMESTDDTVEIARRHGCRVVTFERGEHRICEPARDFAIHAAANEWVLVVDADEVVPEALTRFLYKLVEAPDCPDAMFVPRSNLFLGKRYYNTTDYQLRFMRKDKAYWPPVIHSHPKIDGTIGKIPRKHKDLYLIHLDDSPLDKRYQKMESYTDYELQRRLSKNYGVASFMFRPAWFFFRSYILQGGCCDGVRGIIRAYFAMTYQVMLMSKIMERRFSQDSKKK